MLPGGGNTNLPSSPGTRPGQMPAAERLLGVAPDVVRLLEFKTKKFLFFIKKFYLFLKTINFADISQAA
jgi:hypothetical protein